VRRHRLAVLSIICAAAFMGLAQAQTIPFTLTVQQGTNAPATIGNNSTVDLTATGVGAPQTFTFKATYVGTTTAVISSAPQILGPADFTIAPIPGLPLTLQPGGSVTMMVTYTPTVATGESAQINLGFTQSAATSTGTATIGTITLNVVGEVPQFTVSYALANNGNIITIPTGGTIQYLPTAVGTTATAAVLVVNRGSGPGTISSIAVTGAAFAPFALPLLPSTLASGGDLQFQIQYTPTAVGSTDTGTVTITYGDGTTFTANLSGSGIGSGFSYSLIANGTTTPITPGQSVTLPSVAVGVSESVMIQIKNTGNAAGTINVIAISGAGFTVTNLPIIPTTLAPGATALFTVNVTPQAPGPVDGTLRINNDLITLVVNGIGSSLTYSYVTAGTTTTIVPTTGTVLFSPLEVSQTASLPFTITNTGTSSALIATIGITSSSAPFTLSGLPSLPMNLQPGASVSFSINFNPTATGEATATLLVNAEPFALIGFGNQPPALPGYTITGVSGTVGPLQQPSIGLTLNSAYPLDLTGTLLIQVTPNSFSADPAIQFSTGGTTVAFTIPAGQTQAIFPNGATTIRFQTGTVAGGITITPTFATTTGLNLTPANPTNLQLTVPSLAPVLQTVAISTASSTGFTVVVSGYVTSLSVTTLNFTFTAASGVKTTTSTFSLDVSSASSLWFSSAAAAAFGGQFSIAIPFTLQALGGADAATALQSVAVTATNSVGTSNSVNAPFP
jgi:hypothetical protein